VPAALPPTHCDNPNCLQTLANVPQRAYVCKVSPDGTALSRILGRGGAEELGEARAGLGDFWPER